MTKNELGQLLDLRKEIKKLDEKIERMQGQRAGKATDKVHASMREHPYVYTTKTITGEDARGKKSRRAMTDSEILLLKRRQEAVEAEHKISEYIRNIKDSKIRRIIGLRYEEGLPWGEVAKEMACDRTYPEKMLAKYLREHP